MKLVALAAIVAAIAIPTAFARTNSNTLTGTVGPGFTITLTQAGKKVSKLKAGVYVIKVNDKSAIHDFHLTGRGVNKTTSIGKIASYTWTVTLKRGTYKYVCDPHSASMFGSFTVS